MKDPFVYIAVAGEDKILAGSLNSETGHVDFTQEFHVPGGPEFLAVDPQKRFLFVACHPRHYEKPISAYDIKMYSYKIDWQTGGLLPINDVTLDVAPVYLQVDQSSKYLLSAYYKTGKAAVHRILEDGSIGEATQWFNSGGGAHSVQVDPSNRFVFLPHVTTSRKNIETWPLSLSSDHILPNASNTILQFRFDEENGTLVPNTPFKLAGERGGGPRHFCFHPGLDVTYFVNEQGCSVTAYTLDASSGTLSPFQIISTIPADYDAYTNCSSIRITHSGKYLYVLNRGLDGITCYSVDSVTGRLSLLQIIETEKRPRELTLDPDDKFLFVVGEEYGRLASYRIEAGGTLTPLGSRNVGRKPMYISVMRQDS